MDIIDRLKSVCTAVWEKVIDYYSFVPFSHIIIFNLTVPLIIQIILINLEIGTLFIYIAANVLFFLYRMKNTDMTVRRISGRETAKRLVITAVSAMAMYYFIATVCLIYLITHLSELFPF